MVLQISKNGGFLFAGYLARPIVVSQTTVVASGDWMIMNNELEKL
jgi:hypothetical protein